MLLHPHTFGHHKLPAGHHHGIDRYDDHDDDDHHDDDDDHDRYDDDNDDDDDDDFAGEHVPEWGQWGSQLHEAGRSAGDYNFHNFYDNMTILMIIITILMMMVTKLMMIMTININLI